jgi:hypothetical protein
MAPLDIDQHLGHWVTAQITKDRTLSGSLHQAQPPPDVRYRFEQPGEQGIISERHQYEPREFISIERGEPLPSD